MDKKTKFKGALPLINQVAAGIDYGVTQSLDSIVKQLSKNNRVFKIT